MLDNKTTFEDIMEQGFSDQVHIFISEINKKNNNSIKNSIKNINYYGYADNDFESEYYNLKNNIDETAWDFNKDVFLSGVKHISDIGSTVLSNLMLYTNDKLIALNKEFNLLCKNANIKNKERLMEVLGELAMIKMGINNNNNNIDIYETNDIENGFIQINSIKNN